jgi:hypothetical protein
LVTVFFARVEVELEGAAPRLIRRMYARANMGHASREEGFVLCSNHSAADELDPVVTLLQRVIALCGRNAPVVGN